MNLREIYQVYKEEIDTQRLAKSYKEKEEEDVMRNRRMERIVSETQMSTIQSHYPADYMSPTSLDTSDEQNDVKQEAPLQPVEMKSIETDLNEVTLDENRIVLPNAGLTGLYEFVPATKIKGS